MSPTVFWDFLCQSSLPIKNLKYRTRYSYSGRDFLEEILRQFARSFSNTLETLSIERNICFNPENIVKAEFSYFPQMVDLEIKECGVSIAFDIPQPAISVPDNWLSSKTKKEEEEEVNITFDINNQAWLHTFRGFSSTFAYSQQIRQLSHQEVLNVIDYYKDYRLKETTNAQETERSLDVHGIIEDWIEDLCRGYVELRYTELLNLS
ncbi:hypothetical protein J3Q64DRAFT_1862609 [Phycomyces blakesleeanus]|uniref:Uncharacterized protein n=1 Tax=Phycomyces blakesleeanus TaxID=4837 RepID=A0ABR3AWY3_PHYBL